MDDDQKLTEVDDTQEADLEQELEERWYCSDCDEYYEDGDQEPSYECGNCGNIFSRSNSYSGDGHQCSECLRFASKLADDGCPDCGNEMEMVTVRETETGYEKVDDET